MNHSSRSRALGLSDTGIIWLCYILYGLSLICGGLTSLVAIIINYIKRGDALRTPTPNAETRLLLSHMRWQINTFWMTLGLSLAAALATVLLVISMLGAVLVYPLWACLLAWYAYRLIKGMLALNSGQEVV